MHAISFARPAFMPGIWQSRANANKTYKHVREPWTPSEAKDLEGFGGTPKPSEGGDLIYINKKLQKERGDLRVRQKL